MIEMDLSINLGASDSRKYLLSIMVGILLKYTHFIVDDENKSMIMPIK
jgi:hypothetical protein